MHGAIKMSDPCAPGAFLCTGSSHQELNLRLSISLRAMLTERGELTWEPQNAPIW